MKPINQVKITFYSRSVNEGFARAALAAFLAQADPTVPQLADIKTAVSEAVTNCTVHAYPAGIGLVNMTAVLYEDGKIKITIADKGSASRMSPRPWSRCSPPATRTRGQGWGSPSCKALWTVCGWYRRRGAAPASP